MCEAFGLTTTAAFNIFMKAVVREKRIPFEIKADDAELTRQKALMAIDSMRQTLQNSGVTEMTLEEVNAEITASRNERKEKNLRGH